jgi:uncharacterized delta-60 repeat protein
MGVQSDGKIIVGGYLGDHKAYGESGWDVASSFNIARLNNDGTWDSTFDANVNNLVGSDAVNKVLVLSDDSILVAGRFDENGTRLVKLNANGTPNTAFNANVDAVGGPGGLGMNATYDIAVDSNGKIVLVGANVDPISPFIIRLNADGTQDTSFTPPVVAMLSSGYDCFVKTVAIQSDDKIVIGGIFDKIVDFNSTDLYVNSIARLNEDGSLDEGFLSSQGDGLQWYEGQVPAIFYYPYISTIKVQGDDRLIVAGDFNSYNGELRNYLCRLDSDGALDPSFGVPNDFYGDNSGFYQEQSHGFSYYTSIHDVYLVSSSEIWAGGYFIKPRKYYVKLDGSGKRTGVGGTYKMKTTGIDDGYFDMYDGGNFFNTNLTQEYDTIFGETVDADLSIPNTHSVGLYEMWAYDPGDSKGVAYKPTTFDATVEDGTDYFGEGSQYFTNMYPGMFVLAATGVDVSEFSVTGDIGADDEADVSMDSFSLTSGSRSFSAFVKSVTKEYGTDEVAPTHIIILPGNSSGVENLHAGPSPYTGDDYGDFEDHCVRGISGKDEIYVIIVAKKDGTLFTTEESTAIAQKFLDIITLSYSASGFVQATSTCLPCRKSDGSISCSKWKYFMADCPKNNRMCSGMSGAYLPAITICNQRLS